ncbi:MAG: phosphoribosylglycinamide formyltransferase [Polyangiales bacterium]
MALPIAVLISGAGGNLGAILEAIDTGRCNARVCAVLSDRGSAAGLEHASARGIARSVVKLKDHADREHWNRALADATAAHRPELVVLAGFMKLVDKSFVQRFGGRVINVHPSLLPLFPGVDGPAQAVRARVRVSGCTVHLVDDGIDSGRIIAQAVVPVLPGDDAERLHARIKGAEHKLLPAVIHAIASGEVTLGGELRVAEPAFDDGAMLVSPLLGALRS